MSGAHTPEPWGISKHGTPDYAPQYGVYAGDGSDHDHVIVKRDNAEADARLIAAAPDLLAALRGMVPTAYMGEPPKQAEFYAPARAAIAKALGR